MENIYLNIICNNFGKLNSRGREGGDDFVEINNPIFVFCCPLEDNTLSEI